MKFSYVFSLVFLSALLINITASEGMSHQPLQSVRFWLDTVLTTGAFVAYALWISYTRIHFSPARNRKFTHFSKQKTTFLYFLFALLPIYIVHLAMIAVVGEALDIVKAMVLHYLLYYMPTIVVLTFLYAFALWKKEWYGLLYHAPMPNDIENRISTQASYRSSSEAQELINQERFISNLPPSLLDPPRDGFPEENRPAKKMVIKPHRSTESIGIKRPQENFKEVDKTDRSRFDNDSYPQNLYYFLMEKGGSKVLMRGAAPRFVDIVFINSASRWRYVILRNGEKLQADAVLNRLKQRELHNWMLKISANVYVNMQLIIYPIKKNACRLELQPDVVAALLDKHSLVDQKQFLKIGRGMPKDLLEKFLENVKTMNHNGWDDFIPLT